VSKEHAELFLRSGALNVRDLGSKNGTFVNSERVGEAPLREGDILHFAQVEFRVGRQEIDEGDEQGLEPSTVSLSDTKPRPAPTSATGSRSSSSRHARLPELLRERR
jgi:pSer/pThr/pTyr-binding forkhead associated (FHA) protein